MKLPPRIRARAARVRLLALDVDGVLTDGALHFDGEGEHVKTFHVHDGLGLRLLADHGLHVAYITARCSEALEQRVSSLGVGQVFQGQHNKLTALQVLCTQHGLSAQEVAYVGDDWVDLPALRAVGLSVAVADAHPIVREEVDWVLERPGGRGAVREVSDLLLEGQVGLRKACELFVRRCASDAVTPERGELQ